jgi:uncharacterized DUF497 family protein
VRIYTLAIRYILVTDAGFDWDDGNRWEVEDHNVETEEAEEVFGDPHRLSAPAYNVPGERRWALIGSTRSDRVLMVVYTHRSGAIRVVTAYPANVRAQRRYWSQRSRRR